MLKLAKSECCEYRLAILQESEASVNTLKMHTAICHISLNQSVERMEEQQGRINGISARGVMLMTTVEEYDSLTERQMRLGALFCFQAFRHFNHSTLPNNFF